MRPPRMQVWTMSLLCCALAAAPAHAGWGDALKQQANKVVEKGEKKPVGDTGPVQESRIEPKLTPENVAKFKAAMELEVAERARVTKFLATVKTQEDFGKCKQEWLMSDAGQKLSQKYLEGMNGKSGAELQKHIETVGAEVQKGL